MSDAVEVKTLIIDEQEVSARRGQTILEVARENGINIPTLCQMEGLTNVGACRMCLVEIKGSGKLLPACVATVFEGMEVTTNSERLQKQRRNILELLFAERNHICSVCVANGHCELQSLAQEQGLTHVRLPYRNPQLNVDASHERFTIDHNRCILCTRCVRACWHIEGAGTKNVSGRGSKSHIISDLNEPWGDSETCTSCAKCLLSCPTGALFHKGDTAGESIRDRSKLEFIVNAREKKQWRV